MMTGLITVISTLLVGLGGSAEDPQGSLSMEVSEADGQIEVHLIGEASEVKQVAYTLEVTGQSRSKHKGSTTLQAGQRSVLSRIKVSASEDWCARLSVVEDGQTRYELVKGNCESGPTP